MTSSQSIGPTPEVDGSRVLDLAMKLCAIPTEAANELAAADLLYRELRSTPGVELHVEEVVKGRANLVARVRGSGEREPLVLSGHLDAALQPVGWDSPPYEPTIRDGRLYAAGVDDMKGAVAAMAATIEAASRLPFLPGDLVLHAVMHHDTIGLGQKYILASEGPHSGWAICGEPTSMRMSIANGGALKFRVDFTGETAHISRSRDARNALAAAANAYQALQGYVPPHLACSQLPDLPLMLIGKVEGGIDGGRVAPAASLFGDLRTVPGMDRVEFKRELQRLISSVVPPDIDTDVRITAVQRPFIGNSAGGVVRALSRAHEHVLGERPELGTWLPSEAFVTDAADLAHVGLDTVVYGPGDWHYGPNQSVSVAELVNSANVYLNVAADRGEAT